MTRVKGKASRRLGSYGPHSKIFKGKKKGRREGAWKREHNRLGEKQRRKKGKKVSKLLSKQKKTLSPNHKNAAAKPPPPASDEIIMVDDR